MTGILGYDDKAVSIAFDEVAPNDWSESVHKPDILGRWDALAKRPGQRARPSHRGATPDLDEAFTLANGGAIL